MSHLAHWRTLGRGEEFQRLATPHTPTRRMHIQAARASGSKVGFFAADSATYARLLTATNSETNESGYVLLVGGYELQFVALGDRELG